MAEMILELLNLSKTYRDGETILPVLGGVNLSLARGEEVAIIGRSGSGKSTLLNLCGLLDRPDFGEIRLAGNPVSRFSDSRRTALRGREIGFVFQNYHLLPDFTVLENVLLGTAIALGGGMGGQNRLRALEWLDRMGLANRRRHRPAQLSGGEQQRVAIARAMLPEPQILLCDEPTGNLDAATGEDVIARLRSAANEGGMAMLIVTHESAIAAGANRTLCLEAGKLEAPGSKSGRFQRAASRGTDVRGSGRISIQ
ncbi:MAG: ABC transporter ATP-binding protein [Planctomycetota bacterium]|jgi:predicted ABC-type transport system involved in lysophospholipase L1 biosynthesis ATPase subunit|nr:ABC transporter ATP-binding protein [Planctomycetota bacterium]